MDYKVKEKSAPGRDKVEVLGATFEEGKPETGGKEGKWRQKLEKRADKLKYLQTAERYWYGKDWFGSEKRKTEA
jgi:hypothetical protein